MRVLHIRLSLIPLRLVLALALLALVAFGMVASQARAAAMGDCTEDCCMMTGSACCVICAGQADPATPAAKHAARSLSHPAPEIPLPEGRTARPERPPPRPVLS